MCYGEKESREWGQEILKVWKFIILIWVVREGLSKKGTSEQRHEGDEWVSHCGYLEQQVEVKEHVWPSKE